MYAQFNTCSCVCLVLLDFYKSLPLFAPYYYSDVDTVSLEFEAPPEALQPSHLHMRPVKEQQKYKRKRRKGKFVVIVNEFCIYSITVFNQLVLTSLS